MKMEALLQAQGKCVGYIDAETTQIRSVDLGSEKLTDPRRP